MLRQSNKGTQLSEITAGSTLCERKETEGAGTCAAVPCTPGTQPTKTKQHPSQLPQAAGADTQSTQGPGGRETIPPLLEPHGYGTYLLHYFLLESSTSSNSPDHAKVGSRNTSSTLLDYDHHCE